MKSGFKEFMRLVPWFVWGASLIAVPGLMIVSREIIAGRGIAYEHGFWLLFGALVGTLVGFFLRQSRKDYLGYRIVDPLPNDWKTIALLIAGVLLAAGITIMSSMFSKEHVMHVLENHGSFFDWLMGSLTIVGIWLTYNTIVESQRTIRSFDQLYDRIFALVDDTNEGDFRGDLYFLAYTASIGYLALPDRRWDQLSGKLRSLGKRLRMICLDDDDLGSWHNHYVGRSTRRRTTGVLTLDDTFQATDQSKTAAKEATHRKRKSEMMPGFYLIFNSRRAIIVAPFFIPPHPLTLLGMEIPRAQGVQMFGFETTDSRIIEDVSRLFEYYWDAPDNEPNYFDSRAGSAIGIAEGIADKLEKWASDPALAGKCFRYRLMVAEEQPWDKILTYLSAKRSPEECNKYFGNATVYSEKDTLLVSVASEEQKAWIEKNCHGELDDAAEALGLGMNVKIVVTQASAAGGGAH